MRKIIFLDFDGVMVTEKYLEQLMADGCSKQDDYGSFREYSPFDDRDTEALYSQLQAILKK